MVVAIEEEQGWKRMRFGREWSCWDLLLLLLLKRESS